MNVDLKLMLSQLSSAPFNKSNLNLISLDALSGEPLLQLLTDVLSTISGDAKTIDIREEEPDVTVVRVLSTLRLLKYKPPVDISGDFRQGLLEGDKRVVHPVLSWLLMRSNELMKRAYLAKYLVQVEVPPENLSDPELGELHANYLNAIERFKATHKEMESVKGSGYSTGELRSDIEAMEKERELVAKRIERMRRRVDDSDNNAAMAMLEQAANIRRERERQREMHNQKNEQKTLINAAETKMERVQTLLRDLRSSSSGSTAESIVQRLQEECDVSSYLVTQKLPKELEAKKLAVDRLRAITQRPTMSQNELDELKLAVQSAQKQAADMAESRAARDDLESKDSNEENNKLTLFRQQAALVSRKKEGTAEKLQDIQSELNSVSEDVQEKRAQLEQYMGDNHQAMMKGEAFKNYVASLREKSNVYKQKRAVMAEIKVESGILTRTLEILTLKDQQLQQTLADLERDRGVAGYRETQETLEAVVGAKSELDEEKGRSLEEMSELVQQLATKIAERKARLAPIIKELRPLRQRHKELQTVYDEQKAAYDTLVLQLESGMARQSDEVRQYRDEVVQKESKLFATHIEMEKLELLMKRAENELKMYTNNEGSGASFRQRMLKALSEQEKRGKVLREEQKAAKEGVRAAAKQKEMWANLEKLMRCKIDVAQGRSHYQTQHTVQRNHMGAETLVL